MNWDHPTGNTPKTVTLVSLGPTREDYVASLQNPEPLSATESDEIWTLNRGTLHTPHDLSFVMDHIHGEAMQYPRYGAFLWRHDKPIITSNISEPWPPHVHCYPFNEIQEWIADQVGAVHADWWHNSVAYIVVYAGFIGVKQLNVWGADYHHHRSGRVEDGHPNVAYWVAQMERVGMVTTVCEPSTFLGANQRDYIYGYAHDPRRVAVERRRRFYHLIAGRPECASSSSTIIGPGPCIGSPESTDCRPVPCITD